VNTDTEPPSVTASCSTASQTKCLGSKCSGSSSVFLSRLLTVIGSMELVQFAVLLAVIFQADCQTQKSIEVRTGDEAKLSCTTSSDIQFCAFTAPDGTNFFLKKNIPYEGGRITYAGEDESTDCAVKIASVEEKDNGEWKCSITTIKDGQGVTVENAVTVIVSRPPSDVHMEVDDIAVSNLVVNFRQSKSKKIACIADGARPAAAFSWTLGEDRFEGRVEDKEAVRHQDGTVRQVQVLHYEADPAHNGKAISCIVDHKGFSRQDIEMNKNMATVDLDIQFQPVAADKPQSFYNLQVGEEKEILISFRAHPRPTQVFWTMYDKSQVMEGGESLNKRYRADVLKDGPNDGMFTAKLTVAEVMEADAGSNNELSVTNELGTTTYPFKLSLGDRPAAGTGPVIAIVIVAIIIIVVILVAVIARSQGLLCFADPPKSEEDKEKAVEKEEGSETESAKGEEPAKDETDEAAIEEGENGEIINNNTKKASMGSRMTSLLSAMKKQVSRKEKYTEAGGESGELQEGKENGVETDERKDDITYADLDKSAMTSATVAVENEKTTYADIKPGTKE